MPSRASTSPYIAQKQAKRRRVESNQVEQNWCDGTTACLSYDSTEISNLSTSGLSRRIASVLNLVCETNSAMKEREIAELSYPWKKLWTEGNTSVEKVVESVFKAKFMSWSVIVIALVLFDRLQVEGSEQIFAVHATVERLFGMSILLAGKFVEDVPVWNADIAKLLNFDKVQDIHDLEFALLDVLRWRVRTSSKTFRRYANAIMSSRP